MNEREFVREVVQAMENLGIPYFITGGMAAIAYGELRSTSDLDLVAELGLADIPRPLDSQPTNTISRKRPCARPSRADLSSTFCIRPRATKLM